MPARMDDISSPSKTGSSLKQTSDLAENKELGKSVDSECATQSNDQ